MNRVTAGGLACGLALLLTAACTSSGSSGKLPTNGPFGNSGPSTGTICVWTRHGNVVHDSTDEFPNTGGTATISKVALVNPRHLRLVTAWVVPATNALGDTGAGYPPASGYPPGYQWGQRQPIPGAIVRHTQGQHVINLVIVMQASAELGTATAVNLYYKAAGTRYLLHIPYGYKVFVGRTCVS